MHHKPALPIALVLLAIISICEPVEAEDSVYVWFGNLDSTPLTADTGQLLDINVYIITPPDAYVGDCLICLGTENRCIDSLLSLTLGEIYYPFNEWDTVFYLAPQGSPPNQDGWSSQSFIGFSRMVPPYDSPWLHFDEPTIALKMVVKTARNLSLVGELANCLGVGMDQYQTPSYFGDTCGMPIRNEQYFSAVQFAGGGYVAGLVTNTDGEPLGGTIVRDVQTQRTAIAEENGEYLLGGIYQGNHDIWFDPPLYAETTVTSITIIDGQTAVLNLVTGAISDIQRETILPGNYELKQNYPNPFNPVTTIEYLLLEQAYVTVDVYDIQGSLVTSLINQTQRAGRYRVSWNAAEVPSGIYYYRISAGSFTDTKKMMLLK